MVQTALAQTKLGKQFVSAMMDMKTILIFSVALVLIPVICMTVVALPMLSAQQVLTPLSVNVTQTSIYT